MSQNPVTLPTTGTISGLQMTQDTNAALDTLNTLASGPSAPTSPEAGQLWHDTTNNILKIRSLDNTSWITLFSLNEAAYVAFPSQASATNRILNGAMLIDQQNEGNSYSIPTGGNTYTLDQWCIGLQTTSFSGVTVQRVADAPVGFSHSLKVTVATSTSSLASTDTLTIVQLIEGYNIMDWNYGTANAAVFSLSFWVKSSVAGTYAVSLQNGSVNRSYVTDFTISAANTWEQITLANIPGDISGTWNSTNGAGLIISIVIASGTSVQTSTLNTWQNSFVNASTTQTNGVVLTSGSTFQLTGVMVNEGEFCAPFEDRSIAQELALLQRYYEKTMPQGTAAVQNAGFSGVTADPVVHVGAGTHLGRHNFMVTKRTSPSITFFNPGASNNNGVDNGGAAITSLAVEYLGDSSFTASGNTGSSSVGNVVYFHWTASARM